jgi:hypothetical protein
MATELRRCYLLAIDRSTFFFLSGFLLGFWVKRSEGATTCERVSLFSRQETQLLCVL